MLFLFLVLLMLFLPLSSHYFAFKRSNTFNPWIHGNKMYFFDLSLSASRFICLSSLNVATHWHDPRIPKHNSVKTCATPHALPCAVNFSKIHTRRIASATHFPANNIFPQLREWSSCINNLSFLLFGARLNRRQRQSGSNAQTANISQSVPRFEVWGRAASSPPSSNCLLASPRS